MQVGEKILVTTEFRGVFFGTLTSWDVDRRIATLDDARNVVYWSADCKGFLGLASTGPTASCRIGQPVSGLELHKVTSRTPVTAAAVEKFEASPWK